ncbi:MAG: response regulator transcription factor [Vicinamibacterales bacterium]
MRILLVEDDGKLAKLLRKGLEEERHAVIVAGDGPEGLKFSQTYTFDVIVLDVMLPGLNGFEVAQRLRQEQIRTPILMLTARDATGDVVRGLDAGADDYLTKPFPFDELLARLRALSRRGPVEPSSRLRVADLTLEPATHRVFRGDTRVHLSRTEYVLLELLMRQKGRVVSRSTIIEAVWGVGSAIEENTLDAFIRLLRRKLADGQPARLIHTVRGVGYVLREDESS